MSSHSRMTHEHSARLLCTPGDGDERWDKRDHKTIARSICSAPLEQSAAANVQSAAATKQSAASQTNRIMFSRTCWTAHRGFFTTGHSARCNRPSPTHQPWDMHPTSRWKRSSHCHHAARWESMLPSSTHLTKPPVLKTGPGTCH
jgi:hypothetical protein